MVMRLRLKMKGGKFNPLLPGRKWREMNQRFASAAARITLKNMRALTPVDTGLTRDTTIIVHGKPDVPRGGGKVEGAQTYGAYPKTISSFGKGDTEFGELGGGLDRNWQISVGPVTPYAKFVNEGTRHIQARRWIEESAKISEKEISEAAQEVFDDWPMFWKWQPIVGESSPFFKR